MLRSLFQNIRQTLVAAGGRQIVLVLPPEPTQLPGQNLARPYRNQMGRGFDTVVAVIGCELTPVWQEQVMISAATTYSTSHPLRNIN